jgi:hypothetical protein
MAEVHASVARGAAPTAQTEGGFFVFVVLSFYLCFLCLLLWNGARSRQHPRRSETDGNPT